MSLRSIIEEAAAAEGCSLQDLTPMSPSSDPYRLDTPANHLRGAWFAAQMARHGITCLHVRGIHYACVACGDTLKPDGSPYLNDGYNYGWFSDASESARWLGYVPFDRC